MFDRFARSWTLVRQCLALIAEDRRLLVFPLLSGVAMMIILGTFAVPALAILPSFARHGAIRALPPAAWLGFVAFYWLQFSILIFFETALIAVAMKRFDGHPATIGDGLARAWSSLPAILGFALVAATIGALLRAIAERVGFLGRIATGLVGFAWTVATALVAPVLAAEDVGPLDAIGRSVTLIRTAWGEDVIGNVGIGLVFVVATIGVVGVVGVPAIALIAHLQIALGVLLLALAIVAIALIALTCSTLNGVYAASLYRYANGGRDGGIDRAALAQAFVAKH